jgi:alkylation response protein AidB-like acyl-CoA dehydrogenase
MAEIRLFAGNYAPQGWALCNGQQLPIAQHQAIRHKLVTAKTKLQAARHMLYHAAWLANEGLAYCFGLVLVLTAPRLPSPQSTSAARG